MAFLKKQKIWEYKVAIQPINASVAYKTHSLAQTATASVISRSARDKPAAIFSYLAEAFFQDAELGAGLEILRDTEKAVSP